MTEQEVFVLANEALKGIVQRIRDEQWAMEMPPTFRRRDQESVTLRQIISYHAYDDAWVPDTLSGRTMEEVGKGTFDGDLLGDDPKGNFARYADRASAAVRAFDDLDRRVHLSYGEYPAREYLWHITCFRGLRVYDLARAIGADTTMPPALVQGLWDELSPHADEWRALGVFGPEVKVPDDADLQARLLGMTGRQP